jgi:amino acid adenylation domain-containing protein
MPLITETSTSSIADYLEASAARFPERVAVVDPDGRALNYRELDSRAQRVAAFLSGRGVGPGDRVAVWMPKSADAMVAIFGILKARAAYVPIDWTAPAGRARTILQDCRTKAAFVDLRCAAGLKGMEPPQENVILVGDTAQPAAAEVDSAVSWRDVIKHDLPAPSPDDRSREDLAYILYTSGSTGIPKGVMLTQGNALSFVDWCSSIFRISQEDRFSSHAPFHFDLSILDIYLPLKHGASVHLIDDQTGKNPKDLAAFIAQRRLTVWYSTPSVLHLLASLGNLPRFDFSSLRLVLFAGEVFPVKHLRHLTQQWPAPQYYNLYGPTETNVCTYFPVPSSIPGERVEPYPIGAACDHCLAAVLDSEGEPVPRGCEGVLHISGDSVFQGYGNRPQETTGVLRPRDGHRWYSTGDVVREDPEDGFIYVGRRDRMVKRRGYRIELDEIESALYRHERLAEVGVISALTGDAEVKIAAYLAVTQEPAPDIIQMKMFCASVLPAYMNPDVFVFLDRLPRTSTNKVDYQSLKLQFVQDFAPSHTTT